ncbi:MAG: sulfotransferase family 2 domain-containing protein [Actinomycetota bacterium]|nr:sulfotransferase family 2 domain-containing protein [Actinomycetota bacterium]
MSDLVAAAHIASATVARVQELLGQRRTAQRRGRQRATRVEPVDPDFVFFHLGKTGGGSVRQFLRPIRTRWAGVGHDGTLDGIATRWPGTPIVFFVRDPVTRFVSGFNNFRRGVVHKPLGKVPSQIELIAYTVFPTANHLAEALTSDDERMRSTAEWAMGSLGFLANHLTHNLDSPATVDRHLAQIALIGLFEEFADSVEAMRSALHLPDSLRLPEDESRAHRGLSHVPSGLSPAGRAAVAHWYRDDIAIYEHCCAIHRFQMQGLRNA